MRFFNAPTLLALTVSLIGCGGIGDTTNDRSQDPTANLGGGDDHTQSHPGAESALTVVGRVMPDAMSAESTERTISVYELKSGKIDEGDHPKLDDCRCSPDEDGHYEIPLVKLPDGGGPIAVVVEVDGEIAAGVIISVEEALDGEIEAPPITAESTLELQIAASAGLAKETHALAMTQLLVDGQLAAAVQTSADAEQNVAIAADAVVAASVAFQTAIEACLGADADVVIAAAGEAVAEAQAQLQLDLASATSQAEVEAAIEIFAEAFFDAYVEAGCRSADIVIATQAAVDAFLHVTAEIGVEADSAATLRACELLAAQVQAHLAGELSTMGVTGASLDLLAEAHASLMAELEAAANLSVNAEAKIAAAFSAYVQTCRDILEAEVYGVASLAVGIVESTIAELALELKAVIDSCTGTSEEVGEQIAKAHVDYEAAVCDQTTLDGLLEATVDVEALLEVMAELELLDGYCGKSDC